ncbi:hypothetical protein [Luteipulveratus mongoliensis]|uniref:Uncharacterized protein n=1 Tax=Luteipulveratus mongoliensis TaxID=571913 RepID=A0A0K1JHL4_9MICO|nr:hypothetical protein [Luteipulveratus mongoliensis]AKU16197.1 hypothetical protein VV02_10540 [Luteipulveratus mongoliensis]
MSRLRGWLPALVAVAGTVIVLAIYGVSVWDTTRFALASLWSVLLPGVLVHRALRSRPAHLLAEVAPAFAVGVAVRLLAWAAYVALGLGDWLATYPLLVLAVFSAVPGLRQRLHLKPYDERLPVGPAWGLLVAYSLGLARVCANVFESTPLPRRTGMWPPDLYWQLSINAEATRSAPPQVPQASGEVLRYHWFSSAHTAADSLVSKVDLITVSARLWYLPVYAVTLALVYLLTVHLSRRPWAGVLACGLLLAPAALTPILSVPGVGVDALSAASPTEVLGHSMMLLSAWLLIDTLRGRTSGRGWLLLVLMLAACSGAKSSILPTLVGGLAVALVATWRTPARRPTALALGLATLVMAVSIPWFAGGGGGSELEVGGTARHLPAYTSAHLSGPALVLLGVAVAVLMLAQHAHAIGALSLPRRDPTLWFIAGAFTAGFAVVLILVHPSGSQVYFLRGVVPLWAVLSAWGAVHLLERRPPGARDAALAAAAGLAAWGGVRLVAGPTSSAHTVLRLSLAVCLIVVVLGALWALRRPGLATLAVIGVLAAAVVPTGVQTSSHTISELLRDEPRHHLTSGEVTVTGWLRAHTPRDDLVATNVHCRGIAPTPHCDTRSFWVTGLGERAAYVEGWAYTDEARAMHGKDGLPYVRQPFYDPERLRRNDAAFTAPTADVLKRMYADGVRWLVADTRAGPVSPRLRSLARLKISAGEAAVYELRG